MLLATDTISDSPSNAGSLYFLNITNTLNIFAHKYFKHKMYVNHHILLIKLCKNKCYMHV